MHPRSTGARPPLRLASVRTLSISNNMFCPVTLTLVRTSQPLPMQPRPPAVSDEPTRPSTSPVTPANGSHPPALTPLVLPLPSLAQTPWPPVARLQCLPWAAPSAVSACASPVPARPTKRLPRPRSLPHPEFRTEGLTIAG